jgi:hypothetical protein
VNISKELQLFDLGRLRRLSCLEPAFGIPIFDHILKGISTLA